MKQNSDSLFLMKSALMSRNSIRFWETNILACIKGQAKEVMVAKQSDYTSLSSAIPEIIILHNLRLKNVYV